MTKKLEKTLTDNATMTLNNFLTKYTNRSTQGYHGQLVEVTNYPIQDVLKSNFSPKGTPDSIIVTGQGLTVVEIKTNGGDVTEMLNDYNNGLNYVIIYGMFSGFNKKFKKTTGLKIFNLKEFCEILLKYKAIKSRGSQGGYNIDFRHGFQCEILRAADYNRAWDFTLCNINNIEDSVMRMNEEYSQRS